MWSCAGCILFSGSSVGRKTAAAWCRSFEAGSRQYNIFSRSYFCLSWDALLGYRLLSCCTLMRCSCSDRFGATLLMLFVLGQIDKFCTRTMTTSRRALCLPWASSAGIYVLYFSPTTGEGLLLPSTHGQWPNVYSMQA